jgi:hypothetical protein
MKTQEFIKELKDRTAGLKDVNPFWRRVQIIGACVLGVGGLIVAAPFSLPAGLITAGTYMITVGTTITGIAQLTKK